MDSSNLPYKIVQSSLPSIEFTSLWHGAHGAKAEGEESGEGFHHTADVSLQAESSEAFPALQRHTPVAHHGSKITA